MFLPHGIMALLAIYFGWASVMAIFAAHIAAFYLTDNLFIFSENWLGAYTLTDRATWINFANKSDFTILVEGDEALFNPYGIMRVSAQKCPSAKIEEAQIFIDWLISDKGQKLVADYRIDGQSLFFVYAR